MKSVNKPKIEETQKHRHINLEKKSKMDEKFSIHVIKQTFSVKENIKEKIHKSMLTCQISTCSLKTPNTFSTPAFQKPECCWLKSTNRTNKMFDKSFGLYLLGTIKAKSATNTILKKASDFFLTTHV